MTPRVLVYARYSSDAQRDASIEDQVRICRARADREGWDIREVYADHAISGATMLRPDYQRLLADIRAGAGDIVLAESLDRFSRDQEHIAAFYKQVSYAGVRIVTLAEGEVSELHIGLKGTMGALYLKDLAQKTHRGMEGRLRQGRSLGRAPYGYRVVRRLAANGEPDRGLRAIVPEEAATVRRIFREHAAGMSPRQIARRLNAEGVPSPSGGIWYDASIRGRPGRGDGLLRNPVYIGQLVWNRHRTAKDPLTGQNQLRANQREAVVTTAVPELRIIESELWDQVQANLAVQQVPNRKSSTVAAGVNMPARAGSGGFWEHRRARHLLTRKMFCGCCGKPYTGVGKDYLGCSGSIQGACRNGARVRRPHLDDHVLEALGRGLMQPGHVAEFITAFTEEWNRLTAEASAGGDAARRELQAVERKLANLVEAITDGLRAPGLQEKLDQLEARKAQLQAELARPAARLPALHPNLAEIYRRKLTNLRQAMQDKDDPSALEAARNLIDRVVISPPDGDGPPDIELIGQLTELLRTAGLGDRSPVSMGTQASNAANVLAMFASAIKEAKGTSPLTGAGQSPPGSGAEPQPCLAAGS